MRASDLAFAIFARFPVSRGHVLVKFAGDGGGRFTVKRHHSEQRVTAAGWRHERAWLTPPNPDFEPIGIPPEDATDLVIAGGFVVSW